MENNFIIDEMQKCRDYCSLIIRARNNAGFTSLKYPIQEVKINTYFLPQFRELIIDWCNIKSELTDLEVRPMIEHIDEYGEQYWLDEGYHREEKDGMVVLIDTTRSPWQDEVYEERVKHREEAQLRKEQGL